MKTQNRTAVARQRIMAQVCAAMAARMVARPFPVKVERPRASIARAIGSVGIGSVAVGAVALGAVAVGSLAVGRLVVRRFALGEGRIKRLRIDELEVGRLRLLAQEVPSVTLNGDKAAVAAEAEPVR